MERKLENLLQIRYIKLHFSAAILENTKLPADKVSALRGGMGEMLLRANCVRDRNCTQCDFEKECIVRRTMYSKYETSPQFVTTSDSVGYILECEDYSEDFCRGDLLQFNLILFGKTIVYFNQYMQAFFALGQEGIGKNHSRFQIVSVTNTKKQQLLRDNAIYMEQYHIQTLNEYVKYRMNQIQKSGCKNKIIFQTPVTLKYRGVFLESYDIEAVWSAVRRRIYMLESYEGMEHNIYEDTQLAETKLPNIIKQEHNTISVRRYSSTQDKKMTLKGSKGYIELNQIPKDMLPILLAGELIHIGKNTSFGFGRYRIM